LVNEYDDYEPEPPDNSDDFRCVQCEARLKLNRVGMERLCEDCEAEFESSTSGSTEAGLGALPSQQEPASSQFSLLWTEEHGDGAMHQHDFDLTGKYFHKHEPLQHLTGRSSSYFPFTRAK
jgi:predicted amidophosphoribosyltransferase